MPDDLHEYLSFDDPDEQRTWVFDVSFLTSNWTCIFGDGCQGVLTGPAEDLQHGCCSYGAHFIDDDDRKRVEKFARKLTAAEWQFRKRAKERGGPLKKGKDGTWVTRMADDACIFLNRPGFPNGAGCALHQAALARGERPLDWKPGVCWQLPLRLVDETDVYGHVTSTLREWKRRDWGPGGFEFHWWCTEAPDAFRGHVPVYVALRDEIVEMIGQKAYDLLCDQLDDRDAGTLLPHPSLKRGT